MLPDVWDTILSPLRGLVIFLSPPPTSYAVGCILPPLRGCVVADDGVRGEPMRAANPPVPRTRVRAANLPVPRTRPCRELACVPRTCPYREPVDLRSLRADPSTSDCLDEVNESAVTDVTNGTIQIQIGNRNRPACPETRRNSLSMRQLRRSERMQPTAQAVGSRPTPPAQAPEGRKKRPPSQPSDVREQTRKPLR